MVYFEYLNILIAIPVSSSGAPANHCGAGAATRRAED